MAQQESKYDLANDNISVVFDYWNEEQLMAFAYDEGIVLSMSKVGPLFRAIARTRSTVSSSLSSSSSSNNSTLSLQQQQQSDEAMSDNNASSILLGYVEGFVRPTLSLSSSVPSLILHLDKMEVFKKQVQLARDAQPTQFRNGGTIIGVGLLIGYLCVLDYVNNYKNNGKNKSDLMTEFLAIDDETYQHQRLVKYYTTAGFQIIKYVGDDYNDIPDRLIWGGCGTLLRQNCIHLLHKWTKLMERSISKRKRNAVDTNEIQQSKELSN